MLFISRNAFYGVNLFRDSFLHQKKKKTITTTYSEFLIIPYFSPNILAISHYNLSDILPKDSNKTFCNVYKKLATYSCRIQ